VERIPVAVVGASGYAGAELVRILLQHPRVELRGLYAQRKAGEPIARDFPQFAGILDGAYRPFEAEALAREHAVAFLALPHGDSARAARELYARGMTVLDLSADLRLRSVEVFKEWYGEHHAPELLPDAVYGLVERHREALRKARLVAVPGCYPTAAILALAPLLDAGLIAREGIIVDAKSGVSGAGREATRSVHFSEMGEGVRAYKIAAHRHTPEIEQELERAAKGSLKVTFTPHLMPMTRGILATCYATPVDPQRKAEDYAEALHCRRRSSARHDARARLQPRAGRCLVRRTRPPRHRLRRHRQPGQGRRRSGRAMPQRGARLAGDCRPRGDRHLPLICPIYRI
jgi:N-acetyl-gamma-glutamyl-phosphate reductase